MRARAASAVYDHLRDDAKRMDIRKDPHPTRLRRASFSHAWEKEKAPFLNEPPPYAASGAAPTSLRASIGLIGRPKA